MFSFRADGPRKTWVEEEAQTQALHSEKRQTMQTQELHSEKRQTIQTQELHSEKPQRIHVRFCLHKSFACHLPTLPGHAGSIPDADQCRLVKIKEPWLLDSNT